MLHTLSSCTGLRWRRPHPCAAVPLDSAPNRSRTHRRMWERRSTGYRLILPIGELLAAI